MGWFATAGIFLLLFLCITVAEWYQRREETQFEANKQEGVGIVAGYERKVGVSVDKYRCDLLTIIPAINEKVSFLCKTGGGVNAGDYPVGSEVVILYSRKKGKVATVDARLKDTYQYENRLNSVFGIVKLVFLLSSCIMIICGILFINN